jgi:hypothetical protein
MSSQRFTGTEQHVATDDLAVSRLRDSQLGDARVHASSWVNGCFR